MTWAEDWPTALMWASLALFVGALFAIVQFVRNSSDARDDYRWRAVEEPDKAGSKPQRSQEGFSSLGPLVLVVFVVMGSVALAHGPGRDRPLPPNGVLWTPEALLRDFFPASERVAYRKVSLTEEEKTKLATLTGAERESDTQLFYLAKTAGRIDGYAFLDRAARGEAPAEFGVQLGADGRVERVEVMRLADRSQQVVLDPRFLHQFEGTGFSDVARLHRSVDRPMGCASACMDATTAVRRALFLVSRQRSTGAGPPTTDENGDPQNAKKD